MATRNQLNPPPLRTIQDFKAKLSGGGARPNLFEVVLSFPGAVSVNSAVLDKSRFVIKAAAIPGSTIGPISVPFRGRVIKVAGDRTFESWTITVINDTDYGLRSAFENWMNKINKVSDNTGLVTPLDYQADAFVYQMDRDGSTLRAYKMYSVFPTSVAPMPLSYESTDVIQEFTVELQVQWVEAYVGNSPIALGEDIV